jgi:hypothetical protein
MIWWLRLPTSAQRSALAELQSEFQAGTITMISSRPRAEPVARPPSPARYENGSDRIWRQSHPDPRLKQRLEAGEFRPAEC